MEILSTTTEHRKTNLANKMNGKNDKVGGNETSLDMHHLYVKHGVLLKKGILYWWGPDGGQWDWQSKTLLSNFGFYY